jgi:hypothetical protein
MRVIAVLRSYTAVHKYIISDMLAPGTSDGCILFGKAGVGRGEGRMKLRPMTYLVHKLMILVKSGLNLP